MRKKTSTVIGLAIARILIIYVSALSNQAFADEKGNIGSAVSRGQTRAFAQDTIHYLAKILAGPEAQLGLNHILEGQQGSVKHAGLRCSPWDTRDC
jgi:hypothetical protein